MLVGEAVGETIFYAVILAGLIAGYFFSGFNIVLFLYLAMGVCIMVVIGIEIHVKGV